MILSKNVSNNSQIKSQLNLEKQKLEEMRRQTRIAQQNLAEQQRLANEAARSNRIEKGIEKN